MTVTRAQYETWLDELELAVSPFEEPVDLSLDGPADVADGLLDDDFYTEGWYPRWGGPEED